MFKYFETFFLCQDRSELLLSLQENEVGDQKSHDRFMNWFNWETFVELIQQFDPFTDELIEMLWRLLVFKNRRIFLH